MASWLKMLPKPCCLFVHNDHRARQVLTVCEMSGIRIPDEIAVLGCDNDKFICESAVPRISSLEPDFEQTGCAAAWYLDKLVRGMEIIPVPKDSSAARSLVENLHPNERNIPEVSYGVRQIIERASTCDVSGAGRIIAEAKEYIRLNAGRLIRSYEIAAALNISRRLLDMRFRDVLHQTVNEVIMEAALKYAAELLLTTDLPVERIAEHCGYKDRSHFRSEFKKHFSTTMSDYRRNKKQRLTHFLKIEDATPTSTVL